MAKAIATVGIWGAIAAMSFSPIVQQRPEIIGELCVAAAIATVLLWIFG